MTYDEDGNLVDDARWHYSWDAENRLLAMETASAAATAGVAKQKLEFTYDAQGRRVSKKVSNWSGSSYALASQTLFLYDGWNMVAELNALSSNAAVRTYVWGLDLSGSFQGAGGVGGLLLASDGTTTAFAAFDGNGNVAGYVGASSGVTVASYDYNAFGETIVAEGAAVGAFPFGFSTKYTEAESQILYYGLRYYSPTSGRWINRDPIEEDGGLNLNEMVENDLINGVDSLGQARGHFHHPDQPYVTDIPGVMRANGWIHGAALLEYWFAGSGTPNTTEITMGWALGFSRAKEKYDSVFLQKLYGTPAAQQEIIKLAKRYGAFEKGGDFGKVQGTFPELDREYVQQVTVGNPLSDSVDDLFAALGRFSFRLLVQGSICCGSGEGRSIKIQRVGVYIRDSFDFQGDQHLGFWNTKTNYGGKNPLMGWGLNNSDFRNHGSGRDFLVFSDIQVTDLSPAFEFKIQ